LYSFGLSPILCSLLPSSRVDGKQAVHPAQGEYREPRRKIKAKEKCWCMKSGRW